MRRVAIAVGVMASILAALNASAGEVTAIELHGQIQETPAPDLSCTGMRFQSVGGLDGAPTGAGGWTGGSCVDLIMQPGSVTVRDGSFSLGDGLLEGTYEATGAPDATGHVVVTGTFTITGGNGVYEGATGGGTFTADVDLLTTIADVTLIGSLELAA